MLQPKTAVRIMLYWLFFLIVLGVARSETIWLNDFTGVSNGQHIHNYDFWNCTTDHASNDIQSEHWDFYQTTTPYGTCEKNIIDAKRVNLNTTAFNFTFDVLDLSYSLWSEVCRKPNNASYYCGFDTSGSYSTEGYILNWDRSTMTLYRNNGDGGKNLGSASAAFSAPDTITMRFFRNDTPPNNPLWFCVDQNDVTIKCVNDSESMLTWVSTVGIDLYGSGTGERGDLDNLFVSINATGAVDTTPPVIIVNFPNMTYNDTYNLPNVFINVSIDEAGSCITNNTYWVLGFSSLTIFTFNDASAPDNLYHVMLICNDTVGNNGNKTVYFTKDTAMPTMARIGCNSSQTQTGKYNLSVVFSDNNDLWLYNVTVYFQNTTIFFQNWSNIAGKTWNYERVSDNLMNETFTETFYYCDSHTANDFVSGADYELTEDKIMLRTAENQKKYLDIRQDAAPPTYRATNKDIEFSFSHDDGGIREIEIKTDCLIRYLPYSKYKGHFVLCDLYYLDFENEQNDFVEVKKITDNFYVVRTAAGQFNSIGKLNCRTETCTFTFTATPKEYNPYNVDFLKDSKLLNHASLNIETTAGVLMFAVLLILWIVFIILAHAMRIPALHVFNIFYSLFTALICGFVFSTVLGVIIFVFGVLISIAGLL
jgi:hypothetical protein